MLCDKCHKREAKIYCTEIINGEKREQHLCEQCAADYASFQMPDTVDARRGMAGRSLLSGFLEKGYKNQEDNMDEVPRCESCGMSYSEFLKTGRFGCPSCYLAFGKVFNKSLKQIQGSDTHHGKKPKGFISEAERTIESIPEIDKLSLKLQYAIEKEEFEEAARLRDIIRELKKAISQEGCNNA